MRTRKPRPWLTPTGVEIPTEELKKICENWDAKTWERYLKWYESGTKELLVSPGLYDYLADQRTESLFQEFNQTTTPEQRRLCLRLLRSLEPREARILKLTFFGGRTQREIGAEVGLSQPSVRRLKDKAILFLRRGHDGEKRLTRHFMRGMCSEIDTHHNSIWIRPLPFPIREERVYDPSKYQEELVKIKHPALRMAVAELSVREQRIIYLRFWCDLSASEIARELRSSANLMEQVLEAAVFKLKTKIIDNEFGSGPEEGPSCA